MGLLSQNARKVAEKKKLGSEDKLQISYPTGIDFIDYRLGKQNNLVDKLMTGISGGRETLLIGASGSAKTTFAIQAAYNIVKDYDEGLIIHEDFEHATDLERVSKLVGIDSIEELSEKYILQNENISLESFFSYVNEIANLKLDNAKALEVDTGIKDENGKPIKRLPPTVFIVDSLATMYSKDLIDNEEVDGGGMKATKAAKNNNQVIKRLVGSSLISSANIILMVINHITTNIKTSPYAPTNKAINWLDDGESLPGIYVLGIKHSFNCWELLV